MLSLFLRRTFALVSKPSASMVRTLFLAIACACIVLASVHARAQVAPTPILVNTYSSPNSRGNNGQDTATTYNIPLPENAIGGNCVGVALRWSTSHSTPGGFTPTDDKGDTFYQVPENPNDTTNDYTMQVWMTPSVTAGAHIISIPFGGNTATTFIQGITFQVANCGSTPGAITDGHTSNVSTGTEVTAGSLTPGNSGDLLLHFAFADDLGSGAGGGLTPPSITSASLFSQSNISWALKHAELLDGALMQYGVYNSASAIDPEMTVAPSATVMSIAIAIKGASAGAQPSGIYIGGTQVVSLWSPKYGGPDYPEPSITQFPTTGNALVAVVGAGCDITSIVYGSTPFTKRLTYTGAGASETEQVFDLLNYTPDNTKQITITPDTSGCTTQNGYDYDYTIVFYDVSAPTAYWVFDKTATASGNVVSCTSPCTLAGPSITPSTSPGILFADITEWYNEATGIASPWVSDINYSSPLYQGVPLMQLNGWAHYETSSAGTESTTWSFIDATGGTPQGYWASLAASYVNGRPCLGRSPSMCSK